MGELEIPRNVNGQMEVYGASTKINDQLVANFHERGQMASHLVIATLTESPYTPVIDGQEFGVEVSNIYQGVGDDEAPTKDTVVEAQGALAEFLQADVPGSRRISLDKYRTRYSMLLDEVLPSMRTPTQHKEAFAEALVESTRQQGVEVATAAQAVEIVRRAPKALRVLQLEEVYPRYGSTAYADAVTEAGHIVNVAVTRKLHDVYCYGLSREIGRRGGRAPGSRVAYDIEHRVVDLRTSRTRRS